MRQAQFIVGQVIHHKEFAYRGVIIGIDPECKASEEWYAENTDQPSCDQPWYHILVHSETHMTYVPEEYLIQADGDAVVEHPMLMHFFTSYANGRYFKESLN